MTDTGLVRTAATAAVVSIIAAPIGVGLTVASGVGLSGAFDGWILHNAIGAVFAVAAWMILRHRPRHPVGWVLCLSGVLMAVAQTLVNGIGAYVVAQLEPGVTFGELPTWVAWQQWTSSWTWVPAVMVLPTLLLLRFPDGRLPGPLWRWVERLALVAMAAIAFGFGLWLWPPLVRDDLVVGSDAVAQPAGGAGIVLGVAFPLMLVAIVASGASVVVRSRQADADTRRQLRWIAGAMGLLGLASTAFLLPGDVGNEIFKLASAVCLPVVTAAFPIAILKHRLYDIDVIITRAVTYGAMALFVAATYVLVVVGVGTVLADRADLLLSAVATALVAVSFDPLRRRLASLARRLVYGERATPYETLSRLTAHGDHRGDELERLAAAVADGTGAHRVVVWLAVSDRYVAATVRGEQAPPPVTSLDDLPGQLVEAIRTGGEVLGAIAIDKPRAEPVTDSDGALLADVARTAAPVVRGVRLRAELAARAAELRASRRRLVAAADAARQRLERDLHDGAQQELVAIKVKLGLARTLAERDGRQETADHLAALGAATQEAVEAMRVVARGIYPPLLETEGLPAALRAAARHLPGEVVVHATTDRRRGRAVESTLYFTTLALVRAGAGERRAVVHLRDLGPDVVLEVEGRTRPDTATLVAVTDRVGAMGGDLTHDATCVRVRLPTTGDATPPVPATAGAVAPTASTDATGTQRPQPAAAVTGPEVVT